MRIFVLINLSESLFVFCQIVLHGQNHPFEMGWAGHDLRDDPAGVGGHVEKDELELLLVVIELRHVGVVGTGEVISYLDFLRLLIGHGII